MTTVGFGDICAYNRGEMIVASLSMIIGAIILGYVVGHVSLLLEDYHITETIRRKNLEVLTNYCVFIIIYIFFISSFFSLLFNYI